MKKLDLGQRLAAGVFAAFLGVSLWAGYEGKGWRGVPWFIVALAALCLFALVSGRDPVDHREAPGRAEAEASADEDAAVDGAGADGSRT